MRFLKVVYGIIAITTMMIAVSCKKFLDKKPSKSLKVPSTLQDLQALLDHNYFLNERTVSFGQASCDDYYVTDESFNSFPGYVQDCYTFRSYKYSQYPNDWSNVYDIVNVANIILDHIGNIQITEENKNAWGNVKGSALFYRASSLLKGAFVFCNAYDRQTSNNDYGMVLKETSDFNAASVRSTLEQTYRQIIDDLKTSIALLPGVPEHPVRPSAAAASGLLARTYLSMRIYDSCAIYSQLALSLKDELVDYNTIDVESNKPFSGFNEEVIFHLLSGSSTYYCIDTYYAMVDTNLYNSYAENDLRKKAYFSVTTDGVQFKGVYYKTNYELYVGITTDELYLMRAESAARMNDISTALMSLNILMENRYKKNEFTPFEASSPQEALQLILKERRKELIFRGLRWMDIKRLNKEEAGISITRAVAGNTYTLLPNDPYFALPLPDDIIKMTGMPQNPL